MLNKTLDLNSEFQKAGTKSINEWPEGPDAARKRLVMEMGTGMVMLALTLVKYNMHVEFVSRAAHEAQILHRKEPNKGWDKTSDYLWAIAAFVRAVQPLIDKHRQDDNPNPTIFEP